MKIVKRVQSFVQQVADRAGLDDRESRLARDIVVGISQAQSVLLSEIGRVIDRGKDVPLIRTEQRLSKGLRKETSKLDGLPRAYLRSVAPVARTLSFVTVDGTDHVHPYGKAFEVLDRVSDRSVPDKLVKPGYWGVTIEATDGQHRHLPLFYDLYSTKDPAYIAAGAKPWQHQFQRAIAHVLPVTSRFATWLFDRGFDDGEQLHFFRDQLPRHVVRMMRSRLVHLGDRADPAVWNIGVLGDNLRTPHSVAIPYVDKKTHQMRQHGRSFGYVPVRLPEMEHPYTLIVVRADQGQDWLLLASWVPRTTKEVAAIVRAYVVRWGSEEVTRCFKQCTDVENMRVRGFDAMRRLLWLALIAMGLQALWLFRRKRLAHAMIKRVKSFIHHVPFEHYRLWAGTAAALRGGT